MPSGLLRGRHQRRRAARCVSSVLRGMLVDIMIMPVLPAERQHPVESSCQSHLGKVHVIPAHKVEHHHDTSQQCAHAASLLCESGGPRSESEAWCTPAGATELQALFASLGQPVSYQKLFNIMERYDVDESGQLDFGEFLRLFWCACAALLHENPHEPAVTVLPPQHGDSSTVCLSGGWPSASLGRRTRDAVARTVER